MSAQGDWTEFGPFRLFAAERRLLNGETPVPIGGRALDILIALVERAGRGGDQARAIRTGLARYHS